MRYCSSVGDRECERCMQRHDAVTEWDVKSKSVARSKAINKVGKVRVANTTLSPSQRWVPLETGDEILQRAAMVKRHLNIRVNACLVFHDSQDLDHKRMLQAA